ncbi:amidohydrolase [Streptomyces flavofungini]|uniref:amidohydrolase n=1 Tax=Streptomyces flavofungini TaxID=68200 RepID=UPI0034DF787B
MESVYARIGEEVAARAGRLWDVSLALHREPETAYEEHAAARLLAGELEREGFEVERGPAGLPTAFVGRSGHDVMGHDHMGHDHAGHGHTGHDHTVTARDPRVALLMEYDALPLLGHACGHNLIAAAGLGAALAARAALSETGGTLLAVGTPAEESGGGKVAEVEAGLFDGVDAALMFHPGVYDWTWAPLTASAQLRVGFHGRAAHPTGNPTEGIDALGALIQLFNTLGVVQRRLPPGSHVQGIVTDGGRATNIVPEYAEGLFGLRGGTSTALAELVEEVGSCARGVALATCTEVEVTDVGGRYEHFRDNEVLSGAFAHHLRRAGIALSQPAPGIYLGSSDIGNVSTRVPAIHPFVAIMGQEGSDHTPEFARAAAGPRGRAVMLAAAEALACTAADVLLGGGGSSSGDDVRARAWAAFREKAAQGL